MIYPGRKKGTHRIILWAVRKPGEKSRANEKKFEGSYREAEVFEAQWRIQLRAGRSEFRGAPTFGVFCSDEFAPFIKKRIAKTTWKCSYSWRLAALCEEFGNTIISKIATIDVERYQSNREAGAAMINGEVLLLQSVLRYAQKSHGILVQTIEVDRLPVVETRPKAWRLDEVARLLEAAREISPWQVPLLLFGLNTGCRKGEIVACEWTWIDLPGRMIRIPVNDYWQPKNRKPREIPMSDALGAMLSAPGPRGRHKRWVFPSRDGGRFASFPKDAFARLLEHAKLEGSPHWLRHTYASLFLSECPDLPLLAKIMGHSSTYVTELYSHMLPDHLAKGRNAVNIGAGPVAVPTSRKARNHG